jgi:hypothetical protein
MKKTYSLLLAMALCAIIAVACSNGNANRVESPSVNQGFEHPSGTDSAATPGNTHEERYPAKIDLPRARFAENMRGEIVNSAGIDYVFENDTLTFDADENIILTFVAYDADGVRLNYES